LEPTAEKPIEHDLVTPLIRDPQFILSLRSRVCAVSECVAAKQNRQLREMAGETIANTRSPEAKVDRHPGLLGESRDPFLGEC
jgi:hypothetical protein